jgi:hypothetical protein
MLSTLGGIDSNFVVYGLSNIKSYDHLDYDNLMHLDVHFPDPYFFDLNTKRDSVFMYSFEKKFTTSPSKFSLVGYNIMLNFCGEVNLYNLERFRIGSGKINKFSPLVHYRNYELIRAIK